MGVRIAGLFGRAPGDRQVLPGATAWRAKGDRPVRGGLNAPPGRVDLPRLEALDVRVQTAHNPGTSAARRSGFTLIELVLVLAIIGVIAMIAIPRMSRAADSAKAAQTTANQRALQDAIDHYAAEHNDRSPAINPDGSVTTNNALFMKRLTQTTDDWGNLDSAGIYGPYLRSVPRNVFNSLFTIRVDGDLPGAGSAAWAFDSTTSTIIPDDPGVVTRLKLDAASVSAAKADAVAAE